MRKTLKATILAATLGALLGVATQATAQPCDKDGCVTIEESTLNEFADAIGTLEADGRRELAVLPLGLRELRVVLCGDWEVDVSQIRFSIRPETEGSVVSAMVTGRYNCFGQWLQFQSSASTGVAVTLADNGNALLFTTSSWIIDLDFPVPGIGDISFPIPNVAPSLSFVMPIRSATFRIRTARGPRAMRLTPQDVELSLEDGRIRLESDVILW